MSGREKFSRISRQFSRVLKKKKAVESELTRDSVKTSLSGSDSLSFIRQRIQKGVLMSERHKVMNFGHVKYPVYIPISLPLHTRL